MATFFKDANGALFTAVSRDAKVPEGFEEIKANSVDAAQEKHVPAVELQRDGHVVFAKVGEVEHPMAEDHYIEWIALECDGRLEVHNLKPGQTPATFFAGGVKSGKVYAYCNLHGLWVKEF